MAEIINNKQAKGKKFVAKLIRVDLTPMVDLGFILITFFVFTSALNEPKALGMVTPKDSDSVQDEICESCAITIVPTQNNQYWFYEGAFNGQMQLAKNGISELRAIMMNKKKSTEAIQRQPILIVKPSETSNFNQLVKLVDESKICAYPRYYLDEINEEEKLFVGSQQENVL
jgi:biopolymer transport protein ExbD